MPRDLPRGFSFDQLHADAVALAALAQRATALCRELARVLVEVERQAGAFHERAAEWRRPA